MKIYWITLTYKIQENKKKVDNILHSVIFGHNLNLCYFASVKTAITAFLIIIFVHTDFPFYGVESFGTQDFKGRRYDVTQKMMP